MAKKKTAAKKTDGKKKVVAKPTIKSVLAGIQKSYGPGSIGHLTGARVAKVPVIPSGSLVIDHALGIGGYPRGRIIEVYGPESSGKTTLCLHAIAEAQKLGGMCAFIDAEHALDVSYAKNLGIDIDKLLISQPDNGEMALNIAEQLAASGTVSLIVVDSVAALVPKAELEGEVGDFHVGVQARMMGQALRKLAGVCSRSNTTIIFINQIRMKIGVMFGSPETTPGGNALKFFASVRIDIRRREKIKGTGDADLIGNHGRVKVVKNKLAPPYREAEFDIIWGEGIDTYGDVMSVGLELGIVVKDSGHRYHYGEEALGHGFASASLTLREDEELFVKLYAEVRKELLA